MDAKKSNKIRDIVRLQQLLKKWRKTAHASKCNHHNSTPTTPTTTNTSGSSSGGGNKGIKFLKKTLSFSDNSVNTSTEQYVPKGYLAVCVGKELKRYVIPTEYLSHQAFGILLREAEEEFGFQQEGVLKIPCDVETFERILKMVVEKRDEFYFHEFGSNNVYDCEVTSSSLSGYCSPECEQLLQPSLPQLCR